MKKYPRRIFWSIVVLTVLAILVDLPRQFTVSYNFPTLPLLHKKISINKTLVGFNPDFFVAGTHIVRDFSFREGLDLQGGTEITLRANMADIQKDQRKNALSSAKTVIERRVNLFGVSEPAVQTAQTNNDYRIIVELPGVTDVNQAVALVGTTAKLEFRSLLPTATLSATLNYKDTQSISLGGSDLKSAQASFDQSNGQPVVLFTVAPSSQDKFYETTRKLMGQRMAICLDMSCFSAPVVQTGIRDSGQISGGFTTNQTNELATQLNAGALPVPLSVLEQHTVGATLGSQSLQKSLAAGILGFLIIVLFMSVLYRKLGVIAGFALTLYALFVLAIFKIIPVTLTLAGIAGFILSIGMAVDANILIFERMREEIRRGKSRDIAIELGFTRAWMSIRDSNISSLITSSILYYFGSSIVRNFAVTLAIGVLISMFSAVVVTRTFLRMIYR